jgi:lysophospholipase L1-like esterase
MLQAGVTYTRISTDSFMDFWQKADPRDPTYEQWQSLLIQEAKALAYGQGNNRLSVIVGDSLTMWFPTDKLSKNNLWLNQGISGENTTQILRRLKYKDFGQTRPDRIYVMAGINDLRQGAADQTIINNHRQIMRQLHKDYPQAEIIVQSILPTRFALPQPAIRNDHNSRRSKFPESLRHISQPRRATPPGINHRRSLHGGLRGLELVNQSINKNN